VGEGATAPAGGPHAEVVALVRGRAPGPAARPPTSRSNRAPTTAAPRPARRARGRRRAGWSTPPDPNPPAAGARGCGAAGVEVAGPDEVGRPVRRRRRAARGVPHGRRSRPRPHVTLKLAQTADGRAGGAGRCPVDHRSRRPRGRAPVACGRRRRPGRGRHRARRRPPARRAGWPGRPPSRGRWCSTPTCAPRRDAGSSPRRAGVSRRDGRPGGPTRRARAAGAEVVEVPAGRRGRVDLPAALAALATDRDHLGPRRARRAPWPPRCSTPTWSTAWSCTSGLALGDGPPAAPYPAPPGPGGPNAAPAGPDPSCTCCSTSSPRRSPDVHRHRRGGRPRHGRRGRLRRRGGRHARLHVACDEVVATAAHRVTRSP
jgi:hypothetical protein